MKSRGGSAEYAVAPDARARFCATYSHTSYYPALSGPSYGQIHLSSSGFDGSNGRTGAPISMTSLGGGGGRPLLLMPPITTAQPDGLNGGGLAEVAEPPQQQRHGTGGQPQRRRERLLCCCCCVLATGLLAVSGFLLLSYLPAFRPPAVVSNSATVRPSLESAGCRIPLRPTSTETGGGSGNGGGSSAAGPANCLGLACLKAASEMEEMLNRSADPCAGDFFAFACDGWLADNHMPPTAAVWSRLERLQLATDGHLREMLEEKPQPPDEAEGPSSVDAWEPKLKAFYEACISVEDPRLTQCAAASIKGEAADPGGGGGGMTSGGASEKEDPFQSLLNTCQGKRRLSDRVICLQVDLGVDAFFKLRVAASAWNPGEQLLLLDEYSEPDLGDLRADRASLRSLITTLVDDLGHLGAGVGRNYAESVLTVLDSLAEISLPESHQFKAEPQLRAEMLTVADLRQRLEGSSIRFDHLIAYFLNRSQEAIVDSVTVAVGNLGYFTRLDSLMKQLRDDDVKKFLEFSVILKYAPFYSSRSRRDLLRHRARLMGQEHAEDDWQPCLRQLRGPGLNAIFYREQKRKLRLEMVSTLIVPNLKFAFVDLVQNRTDIDPSVKLKVVDKLNTMRFIIGCSEPHMTQHFLDQYYSGWKAGPGQSLLKMAVNLTQLELERMRARLLDGTGRRLGFEETLDITSVYPSYRYAENAVFVPAAFFQWPFYLAGNTMPDYMKFALIGSAIATQMAKSLDTIGANWEANGLRSGQRISVVTAEAEACMLSRLQATAAVPGRPSSIRSTPVNPALTSSLGLQVTTEAYRLYSSRSVRQLSLPTVNFSPGESLFVAYAQAHCGCERPEFLSRHAGTYLSLRDRVRLALQHNRMFRQLFRCPTANDQRNCLLDSNFS